MQTILIWLGMEKVIKEPQLAGSRYSPDGGTTDLVPHGTLFHSWSSHGQDMPVSSSLLKRDAYLQEQYFTAQQDSALRTTPLPPPRTQWWITVVPRLSLAGATDLQGCMLPRTPSHVQRGHRRSNGQRRDRSGLPGILARPAILAFYRPLGSIIRNVNEGYWCV